MLTETRVMRSPTRYYGGKFNLAKWLISFFPKHHSYVEPCCGGLSVLLQKTPSLLETANDLDGKVVNFFRVVRDNHNELVRRINLTPWARSEHTLSTVDCDDPIEQARRFFVMAHMSMAGNPASGWRRVVDIRLCNGFPTLETKHLLSVANRLKNVQLENRDALYIIKSYDTDSTLFYFDPPYVEETRTDKNQYGIDWKGDSFHVQSAELLYKCKGYVVVSGYACPLYTELYESHGWQRFDKKAMVNGGDSRIESVWLSPRTSIALGQPQQLGLLHPMSSD